MKEEKWKIKEVKREREEGREKKERLKKDERRMFGRRK